MGQVAVHCAVIIIACNPRIIPTDSSTNAVNMDTLQSHQFGRGLQFLQICKGTFENTRRKEGFLILGSSEEEASEYFYGV